MMKSNNFYDNATCPIKDECLFYLKENLSANDVIFYADHCLRGGEGCGLKKNYDLSERVKRMQEGKNEI